MSSMSKKRYIIPVFIPHRGCPCECSFCNQLKITGCQEGVDQETFDQTVETHLSFLPMNSTERELAFYGGSFTCLPFNVMVAYLQKAQVLKNTGLIHRIRVSTRPDGIDVRILETLSRFSVDTIELGVQSSSDRVLSLNRRGHSFSDVKQSCALIRDYDFKLGLQMMTHLYGASRKDDWNTAMAISQLKPDFVRVYPTLVLKGTALETWWLEGHYLPPSVEESTESLINIFLLFQHRKIPIIRLGLQTTDEISDSGDVVAGPYHPNMRQLVESEIFKGVITEALTKFRGEKDVTLHVSSPLISSVAGVHGVNRQSYHDVLKVSKVGILPIVGSGKKVVITSNASKIELTLEDIMEKAYQMMKEGEGNEIKKN